MLDAIRRFLTDFGDSPAGAPASEDELQLAAAALLFHVIAVDGVISDGERTMLKAVLARRFGLESDQVGELLQAAQSADAEAVDLYAFTSVLKQRLDLKERERIIAMMWELVYADGSAHELEDNVVWRVSELLGVSARIRVLLKMEASGRGH